MKNSEYIKDLHSTNDFLADLLLSISCPEGFLVYSDFQQAGKGQSGNSWESERGKNLLFSLLLFPRNIEINASFLVSQITSIAIKNTLDRYVSELSVKWPNDIYWREQKIGGILIENSLKANKLEQSIIGVGLNVNQKKFFSSAPNPVSLSQITGRDYDRLALLEEIRACLLDIYHNWTAEEIRDEYMRVLYRNRGFYSFESEGRQFEAKIKGIEPDGELWLETKEGEVKRFYFKEVVFL